VRGHTRLIEIGMHDDKKKNLKPRRLIFGFLNVFHQYGFDIERV